jgi:hypothetical protein
MFVIHSIFGILDHLSGALRVRLRRLILKLGATPDLSFINEDLAIGGVCKTDGLWKSGIQAVLDLRQEAHDDPEVIRKYSLDYLKIGVPDRGTPSAEDALHALEWIEEQLRNKKKIFIHCNLGRGRAPLLACIYLISQGMNVENAINLVKGVRSYTYFNSDQLKCLYGFRNGKLGKT